jgi:hypothetical protein
MQLPIVIGIDVSDVLQPDMIRTKIKFDYADVRAVKLLMQREVKVKPSPQTSQ